VIGIIRFGHDARSAGETEGIMRGRKWMTAGLIAATAGLVLAGCGGGGGSKSSATTASSAASNAGGPATLSLATQDFKFVPTTLTATAGKPVTVTVKNNGQAEHNFSISSLQVDKDVEKGATQTVTFTPSQSGTVQFFCKYHKDTQGMVGSLTVT
jgi:plastocyanin